MDPETFLSPSALSAQDISRDLKHLQHVIKVQGMMYSALRSQEQQSTALEEIGEPDTDLPDSVFELEWPGMLAPESHWKIAITELTMGMKAQESFAVRLILVLSMAPLLSPQILDILSFPDAMGREFTEYGRFKEPAHQGFIPTVQTALFLLAGNDLDLRIRLSRLFRPGSSLIDKGVLSLKKPAGGGSFVQHQIAITDSWLHFITTGETMLPDFSQDFPARQVNTKMGWEDLVLHASTLHQVDELKNWLVYREAVGADPVLGKRVQPGYRALFYGPPGTGKTLTVALLGKEAGLPVFRVDLSLLVSKYIGETEKNLSRLFSEAVGKDWILFFDEADALFGQRTQTQTAHDKYANQEVSYLLQRVEEHPGLVILASNFKSNIDRAFLRRFQSVIHFSAPRYEERLQLWEKAWPANMPPDKSVQLEQIARKYEVTGANIVNIVHTTFLASLHDGQATISWPRLYKAIEKEFQKEERFMEG